MDLRQCLPSLDLLRKSPPSGSNPDQSSICAVCSAAQSLRLPKELPRTLCKAVCLSIKHSTATGKLKDSDLLNISMPSDGAAAAGCNDAADTLKIAIRCNRPTNDSLFQQDHGFPRSKNEQNRWLEKGDPTTAEQK